MEIILASLSELNQQHYKRTMIMSTAARLDATNVVRNSQGQRGNPPSPGGISGHYSPWSATKINPTYEKTSTA